MGQMCAHYHPLFLSSVLREHLFVEGTQLFPGKWVSLFGQRSRGSPVSRKPSISHTHSLLPGLPYSPVKQILTAPPLHFQAHTLQSPLFSEEETEVLRGSDFPKAPQDSIKTPPHICGSYLATQGTQLDKGRELQRALQAWATRCPSGLERRSAPESPLGAQW